MSDRTAMHQALEQEVATTCELMMAEGRAVFSLVIVRQDDAYTVARDGRGDITPEVLIHLAKLLEREVSTLRQRAADMLAWATRPISPSAMRSASDARPWAWCAAQEQAAFRWAADCVDCHDPLDEARVKACPGATRCITCQEAFERRRALFPRRRL